MEQHTLREKLQNEFDLEQWKQVLEACFPERIFYGSPKPAIFSRQEQRELAEHIHHIGEVDLGETKLAFIDVQLKEDATQLTRNRVGLRKLVDSEVIAGVRDAAIIVYHQPDYPEWRISFYSEQYGWDEKEGIVKEETNPKRYTFVVGGNESCRTPAQRLQTLIDKAANVQLDDVMQAFSVEKVSKRFFDEYKHQYDKFVGHLTGKVWTKSGVKEVGDRISQFQFYFKATTDHEKEARDFVKKLLGRIVFLYFVQKKQWLGASSTEFKDGKPDFIYKLFKQVPDDQKGQFYSQWLTKLFFDTLNRDDDHAFEMPDDSTVYIPFLNGGLFEKDETDQNTESLPLPGELFSNPGDTESPNTRGFLDFLSAYNFTIHEDSPGDHTIAVDPEMLGHIFENLLEDNKDKGAYYTPKPIVHYMCQESLIEYLNTRLSGNDELRSHIEALIKHQETGEVDPFLEEILIALKEVKVCDPAIGSGAFPMGILQEIYQAVEMLHHLSPDNVRAIWGLPDDDWHPAEVKRQIIQNSIYGVDIEKGAVDIARLRFWLSLIVDEEKPTALPNLDYKIVVGDSLVSKLVLNGQEKVVEINWDIKHDVESLRPHVQNLKATLDSIVKKQKDFFEADNEAKNELRQEIKKLKIDALTYQLKYDREYYSQKTEVKGGMMPTSSDKEHNLNREMQLKEYTKLIEELQKMKSNPESEFQHFEWKLDFPEILNEQFTENPGFDIVIANPPYFSLETADSNYKKNLEVLYQSYAGKADILYFFFEKALNILKKEGNLIFITSRYFLEATYAKKLRKYIAENANILELTDFVDKKIFQDANIHTIISFLRKSTDDVNTIVRQIKDENILNLDSDENFKNFELRLDGTEWILTNKIEAQIFNKIKSTGELLGSISIIEQGQKTGRNSVYNISEEMAQSFEKEPLRKLIKNSHINKYNVDYKNRYLIYCDDDFEIEEFPKIKKYLFKHKDTLIKRAEARDGKYSWYRLQRPRDEDLFLAEEKIVVPYRAKHNKFAYDDQQYFNDGGDIRIIVLKEDKGHNIKYVIGILNSKLMNFFYSFIGRKKGKMFEYFVEPLEKIPIANVDTDPGIADLVDQILTQKKSNPEADTTLLEQQIDMLVYKLYNLTWEEVQVVDPEFGLSEEEYEAVGVE